MRRRKDTGQDRGVRIALFAGLVAFAAWVAWMARTPATEPEDPLTVDLARLTRLAAILQTAPSPMPLALDGRIDVYRPLRGAGGSLLGSRRFGTAPTEREVRAGDYGNFAYERFSGEVHRGEAVPILWDREPWEGGRLVAFADGTARRVPEAEIGGLLAGHGQSP